MAEIKYLSYAGLLTYDELIKKYIGKLFEDLTKGEVATLLGLVETLIGEDASKSVREIANEELVSQLIPESAKESLDTLQEIAAWIQLHPDDAAAMNAAILANAAAIGAAKEAVGTEGEEGYVAPVAASGLTKRVDDLEALMGEDSVEDQITEAIEALDATVTVKDADSDKEVVTVVIAQADGALDQDNSSVRVVTKALGDINLVKGEDGVYTAPLSATTDKGLATAADVAKVIVDNEQVIAEAFNNHEARVATLEGLLGDGDGSVADLIQDAIDAITGTLADDDAATLESINDELDAIDAALDTLNGDATTEGSVAKAVKTLEDTAIDATSAKEGVSNDVVVTLSGTVGAPTISVTNNFIAITNGEIDTLFAEEESSDIIGG